MSIWCSSSGLFSFLFAETHADLLDTQHTITTQFKSDTDPEDFGHNTASESIRTEYSMTEGIPASCY